MEIFVKDFALVINGKQAEKVSNCTTFTDLEIVQFTTEKELTDYAKSKDLEVINPFNFES